MKISLLEPIGVSEELIYELASGFKEKGHEFVYYNQKTTDKNELIKRSEDSDIVIIANNPYPNEVVLAAKKLKMLSIAFTGFDHVGKEALKAAKVTVSNAAGFSNESVSELALGLAISSLRNMVPCDAATRNGGSLAASKLMGNELSGKTVGIIGTGRIGIMTAKLFAAFGCKLLGYSRSERSEAKEAGIKYVPLDSLLAKSDIISLHTPLNDQTKCLISREKIALMKKTALIINCARGGVIDNNALADALNAGEIGAAAIDVFDMEPPIPSDYPLISAKNTIFTPHVAFATKESMVKRAKITFDNVYSYLGGNPKNVVI
ncbi:MAG: 2-hydroxyacid dehydrogenase [Lachnospiraceae bacterium]|nr:2-hydroxyacid dehydrogenase [Lachnospiraceae bacterium]